MSDTQVSGALRQMAAQRWGGSKPVRMAWELALRVHELPDPGRVRLLDAGTLSRKMCQSLSERGKQAGEGSRYLSYGIALYIMYIRYIERGASHVC